MGETAAVSETRIGRYSIVQAEIPGHELVRHGLVNLGILLEDPDTDSLRLRLRRDLDSVVDEEDLDVFGALADDLARKAQEMGAEKLLDSLESSLSGAIRVTDREEILIGDFDRALDRLYRKHVQSNVLEFRTHLPKYSLRAAAGKFLENDEIAEEGWIEAPENLRLTPDMFVAHIEGHSMEPLIPSGSLCVFRYGVVGSRNGRLVLAEDLGGGGNNRYAVKRYSREPEAFEKPVVLQSLNPDYQHWTLDPDEERYRILAEFVRVLD